MHDKNTAHSHSELSRNWFSATVQRGDQTGSRYVYPTLNFNPDTVPSDLARGVYAARVKIDGAIYQGALYFGPRVVKDEEHDVLEVYVLGYEGDVYHQRVDFSLEQLIRGVRDFASLEDLKKQVTTDIEAVKKALRDIS